MSIRTRRAAQAERRAYDAGAGDIDWPLPIRGLMSEAARSEVSGVVASTLHNCRPDGPSIVMRDGYAPTQTFSDRARQRIPFEYSSSNDMIEIEPDRIICGDVEYERAFPRLVSSADISSQTIIADGAGPIIRFDGTSFQPAGFDVTTGKDADEFDGVFSHQDRVYLWDSSELAFYYAHQVGAVTGVVMKFPLDRLGNINGTLMIVTSMTVNAAHGMNDVLVLMTTTGWVILYEGLDPGDPLDWRLLGRVKIAPPVNRFAVIEFGSDLWVLTSRGIASIRDSLAQGVMALVTTVARPVSALISDDAKSYGDRDGWQMVSFQDGERVLLNVPVSDIEARQYLYEVASGAWWTADYPAAWWTESGADMIITDHEGRALLIMPGDDDGAPITMAWDSGWVRVGRRTNVVSMTPTIIGHGPLHVDIAILADHHETPSDIERARQIVHIRPEVPGSPVALNQTIGVAASGSVFKSRMCLSGERISIESVTAGAL